MRKGDFSQTTKNILARNAGEECSICKDKTVVFVPGRSESIRVGDAAHIYAIGGKGPRNKPDMSPVNMSNEENGIWLCKRCHKIHDAFKDDNIPVTSPEKLIEFKQQHLDYVSSGGFKPTLIEVRLESLEGFSSEAIQAFGDALNSDFKEHFLHIKNPNQIALLNLELDIQFFENLVGLYTPELSRPAWLKFHAGPNRESLILTADKVTFHGNALICQKYKLSLEAIPAGKEVRFSLFSKPFFQNEVAAFEHEIEILQEMDSNLTGAGIDCIFQYEHSSLTKDIRCYLGITFDSAQRKVAALNSLREVPRPINKLIA